MPRPNWALNDSNYINESPMPAVAGPRTPVGFMDCSRYIRFHIVGVKGGKLFLAMIRYLKPHHQLTVQFNTFTQSCS